MDEPGRFVVHRFLTAASAAAALPLLLAVGACSDSQGPSSSALDRSRGADAAASTPASVYVVHGINGTDLGLPASAPVDVAVNGGCVLQGFTFRTIAGPLALPAGSYRVVVSLADAASPCGGAPVIDAQVPLDAGRSYSIVAHLTDGGAPTASRFENELSTGKPVVTARHTANFGAVDITLSRPAASATIPGLVNGAQATTAAFVGPTGVAIAPAGSGTPVFSTSVVLRRNAFYAFYAVGTPANGTFEVLAQQIGR